MPKKNSVSAKGVPITPTTSNSSGCENPRREAVPPPIETPASARYVKQRESACSPMVASSHAARPNVSPNCTTSGGGGSGLQAPRATTTRKRVGFRIPCPLVNRLQREKEGFP